MYRAVIDTPLHSVSVLIQDSGLSELKLISEDDSIRVKRVSKFQQIPSQMQKIHLDETKNWLSCFFEGKKAKSPEIVFESATEFQKEVWSSLHQTTIGDTISYGQLAILAGHHGASRAVGSAMAINPICLIVPCHRVVQGDGSLGNYSGYGGAETKRWLLDHEAKSSFNKIS